MEYKHIAVDIDTYLRLKEAARRNGRTIVGQIRFYLDGQPTEATEERVATNKPTLQGQMDTKLELEQAMARLKYFDEDSPEYEEAVGRIEELQKSA